MGSRSHKAGLRLLGALMLVSVSGCVLGYGPCLLLQPVKHTFAGHVHFRDYPEPAGIDNVAILTLDTTAYVYAPAQSTHCLAANELQMTGLAEFPRNVGENSYVSVDGGLFQSTTSREHTPFLLEVRSIDPINAREGVQSPR